VVPPDPVDPAGDGGRAAARVSGWRAAVQGTPGSLRILAAVTVLACLTFAVLGALAFQSRRDALAQARADAAQLVRVQEISINLVTADAAATNAFLASGQGLPPQASMRTYDEAISTASRLIADAARAQPEDARALALVNDDLTLYTARIAQALQVKRTTQTLGTGYLGLANQTLLRESMLPRLDGVVAADARRVDGAFGASERAGTLLTVSGVAVVLVLVGGSVWLARRTRRMLNVPLVAATGVVGLALVAGGLAMASAQAEADQVRTGSFQATRALADARIAAFTAKADEAITLIRQNYRLQNGEYVDPAASAIARAEERIAAARAAGYRGGVAASLDAWEAAHNEVIEQVNANQLAEAVKAATAPAGAAGGSNTAFATFDAESEQSLQAEAAGVSSGLSGPGTLLLVLGLLALVLGVVAAAASWLGVSQRLEEYR
jgi:hypothetical protein